MKKRPSEAWRRKNIDETKLSIKTKLDELLEDPSARLSFILKQISSLEDLGSDQSRLERFIYAISGLYHHQRFGGLSQKQIQELSELAEAILMVSGIKPGASQLSFLYAELHFALSDLHLNKGEFLGALWEQQLGAQMAILDPQMKARRYLAMTVHSMRLGHCSMALVFVEKALEDCKQEPLLQDKIRIHQVRALRLSSKVEEAQELANLYANQSQSEAYRHEFSWEKACCEVQLGLDPRPLLGLCKRSGPCYSSSYILELFLWLRCHPQTQWIERLAKISTIAQHSEINFRQYPQLYTIVNQLESAYDTSIPFTKRLLSLKKILPKIPALRNVDKEALCWLAIARWLHRNRHAELAGIIFYEYKSLSQKLSQGESHDILGLASDMSAIDWHEKLA